MKESEAYLMRQRREAAGIVEPVTEKLCTHCGQWLARAAFPVSRLVSTGLGSWCRACKAEDLRQRRAERRKTPPAETIEAATQKTCRHCDTTRPVADFPTNKHTRDGRSPWCRSCHNAATRNWKARRKEQAS